MALIFHLQGLGLIAQMVEAGVNPTITTFNVAMHALADYPGKSRADEALALLATIDRLPDVAPDTLTYNILLNACAKVDLTMALTFDIV